MNRRTFLQQAAIGAGLGLAMKTASAQTPASPREVLAGVNYFAGWWERKPNKWNVPPDHDWRADYPERVPLLGEYNTQEVMDREIIAAAENGVDYFMILWYYGKPGQPQTEDTLDLNNGLKYFMASPEARRMKFCIELCNHPPFLAPEESDWQAHIDITLAAMAHPSYLRINGKAVVKIHSGHFVMADCGNDETKAQARLDALRNAARKANLGEILLGCGVGGHEPIPASHWAAKHFNWTGTYMDVPPVEVREEEYPYAVLLAHARRAWAIHADDAIPYLPYLPAGWNPRPWLDNRADFTFPTRVEWVAALEEVQQACRKNQGLGFPGMGAFGTYAWNEFGEGGIVAPTKGDQYMKLEGFKKVFGDKA